ncbi:MAG: hypothetical protein LBL16_04565 [Endomicrobium sp.]|jgi:hypothetical protein|nr:hypothetical protein [Endomicrobium sp.]
MATKFYEKFKHPIKVLIQNEYIRKEYLLFKLCSMTKGSRSAVWEGKIKPSELSREYKVQIEYKEGTKVPKVKILSHRLTDKYGKVPHTYSNDELCLFYWKDNEEYDKNGRLKNL